MSYMSIASGFLSFASKSAIILFIGIMVIIIITQRAL